MAEPSNIRINPFTGTGGATNYVELTEKHIVPANSPYVIRLNEVPEKQDPSNIKMVYVDSATGTATSTTLTEVAATPGQGEFRMDYTTNAMEDKTWNTGLVEFSASDAGKIIQITYTGTGTLAAVNSNHWPSWYTDRGDGSDGDFVPTGNTTISGVKNYKSMFIKSGITVTVALKTRIKCQGALVNNGTITAVGKGASGGVGATDSSGTAGSNGTLTAGGVGGTYKASVSHTGGGGAGGGVIEQYILQNSYDAHLYGAGGGGGGSADSSSTGGKGGAGGGEIIIVTKSITNNGTITANGANGSAGAGGRAAGGGGGGGRIMIVCGDIVKQGAITANGGSAGAGGTTAGAKGGNGVLLIKELGVI